MTPASELLHPSLIPAIFAASIVLYYGVFSRIADRYVLRLVLERAGPAAGESVADLFALVDIAVAAAFQAVLVLVWCVALEIDVWRSLTRGATPGLLLLGAPLLALAELASSSMLASIVVALSLGRRSDEWRQMMESGWVRSFLRSGRSSRGFMSFGLLVSYVGCEEFLFRVVGMAAFSGWSPAAAGVASALLFVGIQAAGMPSWRHALFPICGAAVMGPVHTCLALAGTPALFLIATHVLFFLAAMAASSSMKQLEPGGPCG